MKLDPDEYENWGEEEARHAGGGGGKREHRNPSGVTAVAKKTQGAENAEVLRSEQANKRIKQVVGSLTKGVSENERRTVMNEYLAWVNKCIEGAVVFLDVEKDVTIEAFRSSGAGGQNVNKVSSGIRARHTISGISVRSTESRDQPVNKAEAISKLEIELAKHLDDWRTVLTEGGKNSSPHVLTVQELG